jgi:putative transposase
MLQRLPPNSEMLWQDVKPLVKGESGVLIIDDTTLAKPYATQMVLVMRHWLGCPI